MYTSRNKVLEGGGGRLWLWKHDLMLVIKTNGFYNTGHVGAIVGECICEEVNFV